MGTEGDKNGKGKKQHGKKAEKRAVIFLLPSLLSTDPGWLLWPCK